MAHVYARQIPSNSDESVQDTVESDTDGFEITCRRLLNHQYIQFSQGVVYAFS